MPYFVWFIDWPLYVGLGLELKWKVVHGNLPGPRGLQPLSFRTERSEVRNLFSATSKNRSFASLDSVRHDPLARCPGPVIILVLWTSWHSCWHYSRRPFRSFRLPVPT